MNLTGESAFNMEKDLGKAMVCDSVRAELVAYLNEELADGRREEIDKHMGSCPECARELEGYRDAQKAVSRLKVNRASSDFNSKVQARIAAKIEELRAKGSVRFRTARERADAVRQGPSIDEIKKRTGRAAKLFVVALLLVLPLAGASVWLMHRFAVEQERKRKVHEEYIKKMQTGRDIEERRNASRIRAAVTADVRVQGLTGLKDGQVYLVENHGREDTERCVFVYTAKEWQAFLKLGESRRDTKLYASWKSAVDNVRIERAVGGRLHLPDGIYRRFLNSPREVLALKLPGHLEIWTEDMLLEYLRPRVKLTRPPPPPPPPAED